MSSNTMLLDETYVGERYSYGLRNRPPGIGCVPTGRVVGADRGEHVDFGHGTVDFPRRLTDDEIGSYELTPLTAAHETVYRLCCAVINGPLDGSQSAWEGRMATSGGRVLGSEAVEDTGLDCVLLVAVRGRDRFFRALDKEKGADLWVTPYLLLDAERAEAWHKQSDQ